MTKQRFYRIEDAQKTIRQQEDRGIKAELVFAGHQKITDGEGKAHTSSAATYYVRSGVKYINEDGELE